MCDYFSNPSNFEIELFNTLKFYFNYDKEKYLELKNHIDKINKNYDGENVLLDFIIEFCSFQINGYPKSYNEHYYLFESRKINDIKDHIFEDYNSSIDNQKDDQETKVKFNNVIYKFCKQWYGDYLIKILKNEYSVPEKEIKKIIKKKNLYLFYRMLENDDLYLTYDFINEENTKIIALKLNGEINHNYLYLAQVCRILKDKENIKKLCVRMGEINNHQDLRNRGIRFKNLSNEYYNYFGIIVEKISNVNYIYLSFIHKQETFVIKYIKKCMNESVINYKINDIDYGNLTNEQISAVDLCKDNKICMISGSAGTGKTTICKKIIEFLQANGEFTICCSHTGKAVDRLRQTLSKSEEINQQNNKFYDCHTICSLIAKISKTEYFNKDNYKYSNDYFDKNFIIGGNSINIIIDEATMVSLKYYYKLFELLNKYKHKINRVILLGDNNQLAPIDYGHIFYHLDKSDCIPIYRLKEIHRGKGKKDLMNNIDKFLEHKGGEFNFENNKNFKVYNSYNDRERVIKLYQSILNNKIKKEDIKILCYRKDEVDYFNSEIQQLITEKTNIDKKDEDKFYRYAFEKWDEENDVYVEKNGYWQVGDNIICNRNIPQTDIKNGTEGKIIYIRKCNETNNRYLGIEWNNVYIHRDNESDIDYNEILINVDNKVSNNRDIVNMKDISLSYSITVDKSQGSEWKNIIIFPTYCAKRNYFNTKNKLYTSITRSSEKVFIVSKLNSINNMMNNPYDQYDKAKTDLRLQE